MRTLSVRVFAMVGILFQAQLEPRSPASRGVSHYDATLDADRLFAEGNHAAASAEYSRLAREQPENGRLWRKLGDSLSREGRHAGAADAYERSFVLGFSSPPEGAYAVSRELALAGRSASALDWLQKALDLGYRFRPSIPKDAAFRTLLSSARFRELTGTALAALEDRSRGWQADLDHLTSEVRRVHYRYRRERLPAAFESEARKIRQMIPSASDAQLTVRFQRLLGTLGDGHTLLYPFGMRRGKLRRLDLALYLFADGLFIVGAPPDRSAWIGRRLARIGPLPVEEAVRRLEPMLSRDNAMQGRWAAPFYLTFPDFLREIGAARSTEEVTLSLEDSDGGVETVTLRTPDAEIDPEALPLKLAPSRKPDAGPQPRYLSRLEENFTVEKAPAEGTLYFQFNQVRDAPGETLKDFAARLGAELAGPGVRAVVIDVRNNSGGEAGLLIDLYRTLIAFDTRPQSSIYVLVGRQTFSAAQTFVSTLDTLTDAVFAGEPTGSRPNHLGDETPFVLPYSGIRGSISAGYNATSAKDFREWIAPDVPVALLSDDYFAHRDPVLEAVLT
jgi:tetratricopeptide (TPR) repeat protein